MTKTTWDSVYTIAERLGSNYPDLVAAQWALESGFGKYTSGINNFFGIKGKGTIQKTKEWDGDRFIEIESEFKNFASPEDSIKDLIDKWYKDFRQHTGVNRSATRNEAARQLVKEGYATDPKYSQKLIELMDKYSKAGDVIDKNSRARPVKLIDAAKYYRGEVHQDSAWLLLDGLLTDAQREEFTKAYRRAQKPSRRLLNGVVAPPLNVEYFWQRDSATGHGERSCQSSAIAMAVDYINPNLIQDDDDYLRIVFRYGDTVSQSAHQSALNSLGVKNKFRMDGSQEDIIDLLDRGYPVPIGVLHRGSASSPFGGGHWVTIISYTYDSFIVHDPFGRMNLEQGGYVETDYESGKSVAYKKDLLMKRWLISSQRDGWYWDLSENKIL